jgi:hypothetical protein
MENSKLYLSDISDYLGPAEDRYFSNGFKGVDISYRDADIRRGCYTATVAMLFGVWSKKKGVELTPHIGTTEFISIATVVCQQLMEKEAGLDRKSIDRSWISRFHCRMKSCEGMDYTHVLLSGKIVSAQRGLEHTIYKFEVHVGNICVKLEINCPVKPVDKHYYEQQEHSVDLYREGYKLRDSTITNVHVDSKAMYSAGKITLYEQPCNKKGIGACYGGPLLTDHILVAGQLTQTLLCRINHTSRSKSANLWLREIDAWNETPSDEKICAGEVRFLDFQLLRKRGETWQSVKLSGKVGNIHSCIKVAQRLN